MKQFLYRLLNSKMYTGDKSQHRVHTSKYEDLCM